MKNSMFSVLSQQINVLEAEYSDAMAEAQALMDRSLVNLANYAYDRAIAARNQAVSLRKKLPGSRALSAAA